MGALAQHSDGTSWARNCAANASTNGVDLKSSAHVSSFVSQAPLKRKQPKADVLDVTKITVGLPSKFKPTVPQLDGNDDVLKPYILPDNKTGVVRPFHADPS